MALLKKVPKAPSDGHAYQSRHGWFYIGWGGWIYVFHLAIGRLTISIETTKEHRAQKQARRANPTV